MAPTAAVCPGQVWAVDVVAYKLVSGGKGRLVNVMDIFSRDALGSLVEHSITGEVAARHLAGLFRRYDAPRGRRRDQGLEFAAKLLQKMLLAWRVKDEPIPKAHPYDHGHLESFNGSLREELLEAEWFHTLGEARAKVSEFGLRHSPGLLGRPYGGSGCLWSSAPFGAAGELYPC